MPYVYILRCSDSALYTGYTTDMSRRVKKHNEGKASRYTRGRLPVKCVYYEEVESKSLALKRENEIKKMRRQDKERLINNFVPPSS